jgi:hypothetical protein
VSSGRIVEHLDVFEYRRASLGFAGVVGLDPKVAPQPLPNLQAYAYSPGRAANLMSATGELAGLNSLEVAVPQPLNAKPTAPGLIAFDVRIPRDPNDSFGTSVVRGRRTVVVFEDESHAELAARGASASNLTLEFVKADKVKPLTLHIPVPDKGLFYQAYPGLLRASPLLLEWENPANPRDLRTARGEPNWKQGEFTFDIPREWIPEDAESVTLSDLRLRYHSRKERVLVHGTIHLTVGS